MYWDDKYGTQSVSNEASLNFLAWFVLIGSIMSMVSENCLITQVVAQMRENLNKDSQKLTSNSFLLDDDLR